MTTCKLKSQVQQMRSSSKVRFVQRAAEPAQHRAASRTVNRNGVLLPRNGIRFVAITNTIFAGPYCNFNISGCCNTNNNPVPSVVPKTVSLMFKSSCNNHRDCPWNAALVSEAAKQPEQNLNSEPPTEKRLPWEHFCHIDKGGDTLVAARILYPALP